MGIFSNNLMLDESGVRGRMVPSIFSFPLAPVGLGPGKTISNLGCPRVPWPFGGKCVLLMPGGRRLSSGDSCNGESGSIGDSDDRFREPSGGEGESTVMG
jgi:hypothetical protein